jgi:NhaD family Na+/H+ antiporter
VPYPSRLFSIALLTLWSGLALAGEQHSADLTRNAAGYAALALFGLAYLLVMAEEFTHLRKSKPVMLTAGLIWGLIAWAYATLDLPREAMHDAFQHNLVEYAELLLFLLAAMTYVNAMDERQVFQALRAWLVRRGYSYRILFWITGCIAFLLSPLIDNLTTALVMCAVILAVGKDSPRFVALACINVVVAANAGGAFSPFGDITTLMVWQKGMLSFRAFFALFVPALVNFVIPAAFMHFAVPSFSPQPSADMVMMRRGAKRILALFLITICLAVSCHNYLHLPPMLGMMTGLSLLKFFGYYLRQTHRPTVRGDSPYYGSIGDITPVGDDRPYEIFHQVARVEWDTLLFFYGVVMCVGGLGFMGYLTLLSQAIYVDLGPTTANILVGILSAIVDNIPVMFAVLSMHPDMSSGQWLLVTLTAGVGGSLLSIGSAAGVALMGQARGMYTFVSHLRWTPAIALGYGASIVVHWWLNAELF